MKKFLAMFTTVSIILFAMIGCSSSAPDSDPEPEVTPEVAPEEASDYISIVKNGHLGEYTDVTVKDMLGWYYGISYDSEIWDGGTTDSGEEIVQVQYQDSNGDWDDVTIQFTMLNEQCFKVTAFVDTMETIEESTDLLYVLNNLYYGYFVTQHEDELYSDPDAAMALMQPFIEELDQISASAVQYGASADYNGRRENLCELDGESPLDVSVPYLLDYYGAIDLSAYSSTEPEDISGESGSYPDAGTEGSDEIIETDYYTLTIPASWEGRYICDKQGNDLVFYDKENHENGYGGKLFDISLMMDEYFREWPSYTELGPLVVIYGSMKPEFLGYVVVSYPTDVQCSESGAANYEDMCQDIESIIYSFTPQEGCSLME